MPAVSVLLEMEDVKPMPLSETLNNFSFGGRVRYVQRSQTQSSASASPRY